MFYFGLNGINYINWLRRKKETDILAWSLSRSSSNSAFCMSICCLSWFIASNNCQVTTQCWIRLCPMTAHKAVCCSWEHSTNHCMTDVRKCRKMPHLVMLRKVEKWLCMHIQNLIKTTNWITSRGSSLANAYQVWSTSINAFVSYIADRQTHTDDHTMPALPL